jgi:Ni,Fe-hydrogenase III large subunit
LVLNRFEKTGPLSLESAQELGLVGPAARSSGLKRDVRTDFPFGFYQARPIASAIELSGDVFARAHLRFLEIRNSSKYLEFLLENLPEGPVLSRPFEQALVLRPNALSLSLTEGFRGEICHVAITGPEGKLSRYKIVDPSFHNWPGLAVSMRDEEIYNFPLCNKSFNLSYAGFDL